MTSDTSTRRTYPATFAQQRLWFLDQMEPGGTAYLIPWAIRLTGDLHAAALERTLQELVRRHEILRTTFSMARGEVVQEVHEFSPLPLTFEDLTGHDDPAGAAQRLAMEESQRPLDLARGPLVRWRLLRVSATEHLLLVTLHHILFDGASRAVLIREFSAIYDAFREDRPCPLDPPRLQYGAYAVWQHSKAGQRHETDLAYWKKQLEDIPAVLVLPADRPRPVIETFRGGIESFALPKSLSDGLVQLARRSRASLFMVLLAAFDAVLSKYSGQDDIVVGVPVAGRTREELEGLIGYCANQLALRLQLSDNPTFREMIARMRNVALDAFDHQELPLDKLVREINPERSLSHNPLFQVLFSMRNYEREELRLAGLEVSWSLGSIDTAKFDLSVFVTEGAEGLSGWIEYNTDLYDASTIARMLGHYRVLLEAAAANPGLRLSELPLLTPAERQQIDGWNDTAHDYPADTCLHEFIERQVELTPDAPALRFGSETLSYRELNARANRLAHHLRSLGVGPDAMVAVCAERSLEMVVALVATLKAGGAYLPIDPDTPSGRMSLILEDAQPKAILTLSHLAHLLPAASMPVVALDGDAPPQLESNPEILTRGHHAAYVIYTSGSTGIPKGVVNIHSGIVNRLLWMQSAFGLDATDCVLQKTPYTFDVSVWEFFWPLMTGACLVVSRPEGHKDPRYLADLIVREKITTLHFVPSMLRIFLETEEVEQCTSLRRVIASGEALTKDIERRFFEKLGAELHNLYGPTEAAVDVTWWACRHEDGSSVVPIGRPVWNTKIHILDAQLKPVPVGVAGELHIGGVQLARGYLNRPELTNEKFIADPFCAGGRLYKTGDLARHRADGAIEYLGRMDFQVKIRGFRIELGEIEAVLSQNPAVGECVVVAREDLADDRRLVAYIVPSEENPDSGSELGIEQVSHWASTFDESYTEGGEPADATFNIAGWVSSYTGEPIPAGEMLEWVTATVDSIRKLQPRRVWEIGCGTGLLLFRIAPGAERYHGTDVSRTALERLRRQVQTLPQVSLDCRPAHQRLSAGEKFDVVVLNSVVQYFPSQNYLVDVLAAAVNALEPGGRIFIGDIRSLPLLRTFHTSVQLHRSAGNTRCDHVLARVDQEVRQEGELAIDPEFFHALRERIPAISRVEVHCKRGAAQNELNRFRYEVVLHAGPAVDEAVIPWMHWTRDGLSMVQLVDVLRGSEPAILGLTGVPNGRIAADKAAMAMIEGADRPATVGELRAKIEADPSAVDPQDFWRLEEGFPYRVDVRPSRDGAGLCDVLLRHTAKCAEGAVRFPGSADALRPVRYTNNPLRQKLALTLVPRMREYLGEKLPEYMAPSAFVLLDALPLSSNGKLDRKALPRPEYAREETTAYIAPRTPVEVKVTSVWSEVLQIARIGVADNFFQLGGHSLLGTQAISRLRKEFQVDLPLRALFEAPTVARLADRIEALLRERRALAMPRLEPSRRQGPPPLSFAQMRLWFLDQMGAGNALYNMPFIVRLRGPLQSEVLGWSLQEVVRRHEVLRTRFEAVNGEPVQVIDPSMTMPFTVRDLTSLPETDREAEARRSASEESERPFDLAAGPLVRALLLRIAPQDHVLVVNTHHIVSDGWSLGVLWQELAALYPALLRGTPAALPELTVQYADFATWQRDFLAGDQLSRQLAYWKGRLEGAQQLEFPTDRPRPVAETFRGGRQALLLPAGLLASLKDLSQSQGVTLFMTLLGALNVLLARYTGQDDIVVGSLTSGRNRSEIERLIGFFVNSLVMRTRLDGNPTFREVLARVCETALGADANQDVPFEKLVEELQPVRDLSRNPLFQIMLAMQNMPGPDVKLPGIAASAFPVRKIFSKFDLTLYCTESADGLRLSAEYNTDLFDASTIERLLGHFQILLEAAVANPDLRLLEFPLLTPAETQQLAVWNDTAHDYPRDVPLHQFIERQVELTPDAPAVRFEGAELTYRELNVRANRLAHYLRSTGVRPDEIVAVCAERSLEMVTALVATLKAGGAYLPIEPDTPAGRISLIIEDAKPKAVLTLSRLAHLLPETVAPVLLLDRESPSQPETNPVVLTRGHHAVYVIYTSGSTGTPKGVVNVHSGIVNRLLWMQSAFGLDGSDRVLQKTPYTFDVSVWEFFWPLMTGACLVVARPDGHKDPRYLAGLIEREKITTLHFVPSMLRVFLEAEDVEQCTSLRRVIASGEALTKEIERRYFEKLGAGLHNLYGPTEAAVDVTWWPCRREDAPGVVPIGRPVWNTKIHILDAQLSPVPVGVAGELHIAGAQVARGYLNRPELTAEKFVPDPFQPGGRLYKTGDRARWRPDGAIEYLGRMDFQVKIRGFRIELGEIEAVLGQHPDVKECVVVAREESGDKQLVAYAVAREGSFLSMAELRQFLQLRLPEYMVPAAFVQLPSMPLSTAGKIDRRALPAPDRIAAGAEYVAPRNPTEEALAGILADVLKLDRVSVEDNFFELGGHSLLAVRVVARIRNAFRIDLPLRDLFVTPTVAGLAASVGAAGAQTAIDAEPLLSLTAAETALIVAGVPGGQANIQDIYPLAPLQEGILFHHLMAGEGDPYLLARQFSFDTRARLDRYVAAMQFVVDRHDILRTAIVWEGLAEPVQVVWRKAALVVEEVALDPAAGDVSAQLNARFSPRRLCIDVRQAPLARLYAAHDPANQRWVLLELLHHLAGDHSTLDAMRSEIQAHLLGEAHSLPPALPFRNLVFQARRGVSRDEHEAFFRKMLSHIDEPTAPFGLLDVRGDGTGINQALITLDPSLARRLRRCARSLGISAASLCHLAWALVLARATGREDVVFGTVLFEGTQGGGHDAGSVMGLFINTLPVCIGVGGESVAESARRTHALLGELMRHEHAPLALAQRCSSVAAPAPLFSALLNYRHSAAADRARSEAEVRAWDGIERIYTEERTNYPLTLSVDDLDEGFRLKAQVAVPVEPARVCEFMRTALEALAEALETAPSVPLRSLDVLPSAERQRLLFEWNGNPGEFPTPLCVHELFEAQCEKMPDRTAVVFENRALTYRELNRRANQLAHRLRREGVGPETLVGIWMERSLELPVAILGVLKAGGGYLPLDPVYPADRLAFMLEDARVPVLLTQSCLATRLPAFHGAAICAVIRMDPDWAGSEDDSSNPSSGVRPENVIYVIYTSGSTGKPKGVVVTHANVARLFSATDRWFHFGPDDTWTLFHSYAFDFSVWEIWGALLYGGKVVVVPSLVAKSPEQFHQLLIDQRVTVLNQTPTAFRHLIVADQQSPRSCELALRYVIFGGEALDFQTLQPWFARHPQQPALINMYGITETTVHVTYFEVPPSLAGSSASVIGERIPDLQVYVLDRNRQPTPVGVVGEMYVGGGGVARGYLNRPELTAERFVENTLYPGSGGRLYRTGDLARFLPDGNIQYLGRIDQQVKIRGFRVELGEIEAALLDHPAVRECVVIDREDVVGDRKLAAYLVPRDGVRPPDRELRTLLLARLPEYMAPAAFLWIPELPLTPNGKLNRKALPAPEYVQQEGYVEPRNPTEEMIAGIWADVLRSRRIGVSDNFFELGGHSLLATQVISRIRRSLGCDLPLRTIFDQPTVAALASLALAHSGEAAAPPIVRVGREVPLPLSYSQQRLWVVDQLEPGKPSYNVSLTFRFAGALDAGALAAALRGLLQRHEILRTTYRITNGGPVQVIDPAAEISIRSIDLTGEPAESRGPMARLALDREAQKPFDLASGPMLRATLAKLDAEDHILILTTHHIAIDGWSNGILRRDLAALYAAAVKNEAANLPELPVQYADYASWQRSWLTGPVLEKQLSAWKSVLAGAPPVLTLPADRPRPSGPRNRGTMHCAILPAPLSEQIVQFSRQQNVTPFMTLLAGFESLLHYLTGQSDIVLGTDVAGRMHLETESLIGALVNLLPVRVNVAGDPTFAELAARVRAVALDAYSRQEVPFDKLVEAMEPDRDLADNPLVQVLFVQQNVPRHQAAMDGLRVTNFELGVTSKFDLAVFVKYGNDTFTGNWIFDPGMFDAVRIERMAALYQAVLEKVVQEPTVRLSALAALMAEAEQQKRSEGRQQFQQASVQKLRKMARRPAAVPETGIPIASGDLIQ